METAGYIIVASICERISFWAFLLCELFVGRFWQSCFGCWVWGGGWLSQLGSSMNLGHGYVDFAGSSVVHGVGGFCAMALSIVLGPRLGKFQKDGKIGVFPAHNLVFVVTGTFILLFGWMGFNPGSTLGATDLRISSVAINTNLAAVAGSAAAMVFWYLMFGKPDITMACNGMLAGLVAITAPCAFVSANSSVVIGVLAGFLVCFGVLFNDRNQNRRIHMRCDIGARILRDARRTVCGNIRRRKLRRRLEWRRRGQLSWASGKRGHRFAIRRFPPVSGSTDGRRNLRRLGLRGHFRCV